MGSNHSTPCPCFHWSRLADPAAIAGGSAIAIAVAIAFESFIVAKCSESIRNGSATNPSHFLGKSINEYVTASR